MRDILNLLKRYARFLTPVNITMFVALIKAGEQLYADVVSFVREVLGKTPPPPGAAPMSVAHSPGVIVEDLSGFRGRPDSQDAPAAPFNR